MFVFVYFVCFYVCCVVVSVIICCLQSVRPSDIFFYGVAWKFLLSVLLLLVVWCVVGLLHHVHTYLQLDIHAYIYIYIY